MSPLFIAIFCLVGALAMLLVAFIWVLDNIRANGSWSSGGSIPTATHVPRSVGIPAKWRKERWS